jgi:KUP system potassium uptake protein
VVFPALTLNYLGQGSLILNAPQSIDNPFFLLLPHWARIPMVFVATAATVIASQALISGAFSITTQAVQLGFLPRVHVRHTSQHEVGQTYVPAVNWVLFLGVAAIVVGFGSAAKLASAYGVAVTGTFVVTTILFLVIARVRWQKPGWMIAGAAIVFLVIDLAFFSANLRKIPDGGWLPISIAVVVFTVLMTWQRGHEIVSRNRTEQEGPLRDFIDEIHAMKPPVHRVPGTAVFLNANVETTPLALRANVEHNHALHQSVVILSIQTLRVPHVPQDQRLTIDHLAYGDDGITHVTARFGFQDEPDVPAMLRLAAQAGLEGPIDLSDCSYFLSQITIRPTAAPGMRMWRKKLFVAISRHAASPVEYFRLPPKRTVTTGGQIDV